MRRIIKNEEPRAFTAWKEQEAERLESYYAANNADAAWEQLPSNFPKYKEEGIQYYSKKELIQEQLKEQGNLCCYCNRIIHQNDPIRGDLDFNDRRTTIEHLDPKKDDARNNTFRYDNLVASCSGGETIHKNTKPRITYCNTKRSDKPIAFKPTDEDCEKLVYYTIDGQISGETDQITNTLHTILGLNYFDEERKAEIRGFYYENSEAHYGWVGKESERPELKVISPENAKKIIAHLDKKDVEGNYNEFCSAIIHVLKNEILGEG